MLDRLLCWRILVTSSLKKELNNLLIDLCWSQWTELGVAGVVRKHQNVLIAPEELILLTALISEYDPRLRDEALDWCTRYNQFISVSRLRVLARCFGEIVSQPFSEFAATLNSVSNANWPLLTQATPLKFKPSGKSQLPRLELPSLLYLRMRSIFGVGARADLLTFFLVQKIATFTAADATEVGYTKRNLAEIMDGFVRAGIFGASAVRNQRHYDFVKRESMLHLVGPLPKFSPSWRHILEVVIPLQASINNIENKPESVRVVVIRNILIDLKDNLYRLKLVPPPFQADFTAYWNSFGKWMLETVRGISSEKL